MVTRVLPCVALNIKKWNGPKSLTHVEAVLQIMRSNLENLFDAKNAAIAFYTKREQKEVSIYL
jgi:hypothetical protein